MHAWFWPIGCCDVIILASELKKCIFHWWRPFCLACVFVLSIEVISLTGDRFSPKFWYVVADTILYKTYDIHFLCRLNECSWRHIAIQILYVRSSVRASVRPLKFRLTFFKLLLFEQVCFNYNQTWIIGALWEPSHYDALGGHMTRSKVTWQGQRSFEVKLLL